jgi:hypothetical protein
MEYLAVTQESIEGGIEFADLDSVKNALLLYASGDTAGSHETTRRGFDNTESGGFGLMMKMLIDLDNDDSFMEDLLSGVDTVDMGRPYDRSYDYDGVGAFFKTTVLVSMAQVRRGYYVYLLSLNAAYVGDKPCAELAKAIGADRSLWRDTVTVELAPVGDHFEIDFDDVMERLIAVGLKTMSGQQFAEHTMRQTTKPLDAEYSLPIRSEPLLVIFGLERYSVGDPIDRTSRQVCWTQTGSVISGPLWPHQNPRLTFTVTAPASADQRSWERVPIIDPAIKQAIHDQSAAIVGVFQ